MSYKTPFDPPNESAYEAFSASGIPGRGTLSFERTPDSIVGEINMRNRYRGLRLAQIAGLIALNVAIIGGAKYVDYLNDRPAHCQFFGEKLITTPPGAGPEVLAEQTKGIKNDSNLCLDATISKLIDMNHGKDVLHPITGELFTGPEGVIIDGKAPEQGSLSANQTLLAAYYSALKIT